MERSMAMINHDEEWLGDDCVLIAGGGPVGLVLATTLAFYGVKSVVLERNTTTTRWPKMDLTNARSMEMFRRLGLADELRKQGVPSHFPYAVRISTGLNETENVTLWNHDSVDAYRERIAKQNDGTLPLEPYQRLSQSVFEAWLKSLCDKNPLIDLRFGWKVDSVNEIESGSSVVAMHVKTEKRQKIFARYIGACDGASSRIRRDLGIPLDGGPVPTYALLIHFKSKDLERLHRQGRFWHIFFIGGGQFLGAIIAQDEKDTWTTHLQLPLETDPNTIESHDAVYSVLGGFGEKYEIKIDEILVRSTYRPSIAVARQYISPGGGIFLAGDSAHQNIPTGGYGMNMGLGDAFDLGWKLATVINGHGGPNLLRSYEEDRRPVALSTIERSGVHTATHIQGAALLNITYDQLDSAEGIKAKAMVHEHYQKNNGENTDLGVEMGYRYKSPINIQNLASEEPEWIPSAYIPSTLPGSRAPHVFLNDGSAIFDKFGKYYSLVDFSTVNESQSGSQLLLDIAKNNNVPLKHVLLPNEEHARKIWGNIGLVLIRPDGHVAWRGHKVDDAVSAARIIDAIAGKAAGRQSKVDSPKSLPSKAFSSTTHLDVQTSVYEFNRMGAFQV